MSPETAGTFSEPHGDSPCHAPRASSCPTRVTEVWISTLLPSSLLPGSHLPQPCPTRPPRLSATLSPRCCANPHYLFNKRMDPLVRPSPRLPSSPRSGSQDLILSTGLPSLTHEPGPRGPPSASPGSPHPRDRSTDVTHPLSLTRPCYPVLPGASLPLPPTTPGPTSSQSLPLFLRGPTPSALPLLNPPRAHQSPHCHTPPPLGLQSCPGVLLFPRPSPDKPQRPGCAPCRTSLFSPLLPRLSQDLPWASTVTHEAPISSLSQMPPAHLHPLPFSSLPDLPQPIQPPLPRSSETSSNPASGSLALNSLTQSSLALQSQGPDPYGHGREASPLSPAPAVLDSPGSVSNLCTQRPPPKTG